MRGMEEQRLGGINPAEPSVPGEKTATEWCGIARGRGKRA